jgi:prepilin-type N-terminal cleavage/methylation domain-containing protein
MRNSNGFTLIEVMAALVIAALAIVVLLQAGFTCAAENQAATRYDQALSRTQSRLASIGTLIPVQAETLSGDDGGGYRWHVKMTRLAGNGQIGLYALDLTESFGSRQVELQTERLAVQP